MARCEWTGVRRQRATADSLDPKLQDEQTVLTVTSAGRPVSGASGYQLGEGSPLAGQGLDLGALFGVGVGPQDFFGNAL